MVKGLLHNSVIEIQFSPYLKYLRKGMFSIFIDITFSIHGNSKNKGYAAQNEMSASALT